MWRIQTKRGDTMNREEKRRLGLKDWVVILGLWKKADSALVGVEGSDNKDTIHQIAVKVIADGPTSAVGLACGTIWENAGQQSSLAMVVGAQVLSMKDWEEMQKNTATEATSTTEEKGEAEEKSGLAEVVSLDKKAETNDTDNQPSAPQGEADPQ